MLHPRWTITSRPRQTASHKQQPHVFPGGGCPRPAAWSARAGDTQCWGPMERGTQGRWERPLPPRLSNVGHCSNGADDPGVQRPSDRSSPSATGARAVPQTPPEPRSCHRRACGNPDPSSAALPLCAATGCKAAGARAGTRTIKRAGNRICLTPRQQESPCPPPESLVCGRLLNLASHPRSARLAAALLGAVRTSK